MSEEKKSNSTILLEKILEKLDNLSKQESPKYEHEHKAHEHIHESIDDLLSCPNCLPKIKEKMDKPQVIKPFSETYKERAKSSIYCPECGYPYQNEKEAIEVKDCPSCGGKHAVKKTN